MKFEFSGEFAGTLRVIPVIPDFDLCHIEGKNGIGKTLAARLLEVVSGQHPFSALPHAWESLVDSLGKIRIIVSDLPGGDCLAISLDSAAWKDRTHEDCVRDPGGTVEKNGTASNWAEARRLLKVRRIAGDEGLPETLGKTLRGFAVQAQRGQRAAGRDTQEWSSSLGPFIDFLKVSSDDDLDALRMSLAESISELRKAQDEARDIAERQSAAEESATIVARIAEIESAGSDLVAEYTQAYSALEVSRKRVSALEKRIEEVARKQQTDAQTRALLRDWLHKADLRQRALARAELARQQALRSLGLAAMPDPHEIDEMLRLVRLDLHESARTETTLDNAGTIRNLTEQLERPLTLVPESILSEELLAAPQPVNGRQLREGLRQRRESLRNVPAPEEVLEIRRRIRALQAKLSVLESLPNIETTYRRKAANLREARSEVVLLSATMGSVPGEIDTSLEGARSELGVASLNAAQLLARLQILIEGGSMKSLVNSDESRRGEQLTSDADDDEEEALGEAALVPPPLVGSDLGTAKATLVGRYVETGIGSEDLALEHHESLEKELRRIGEIREKLQVEAVEMGRRLIARRGDVTALSERLVAERTAIASAVSGLAMIGGAWQSWRAGVEAACESHATSLEQVLDELMDPEGVPLADPRRRAGEDQAAKVLGMARTVAIEMMEATARVRDTWDAVSVQLDGLAADLAPRLGTRAGRIAITLEAPEISAVRGWAEHELGHLLSAVELREALFDRADTIYVDLTGQAVLWRRPDGQRMRKPFEAFSSGQQVFAYTRAKLEELRPLREESGAVVAILDEFGAFVARDRFAKLMAFVENEALGPILDQAIVMLPARGNGSVQDMLQTYGSERVFVDEDYVALNVSAL